MYPSPHPHPPKEIAHMFLTDIYMSLDVKPFPRQASPSAIAQLEGVPETLVFSRECFQHGLSRSVGPS